MKNILKKNSMIVHFYYFSRKVFLKVLYLISPVLMSKYLFKQAFHKNLDLKNPKTFNEKIMWLKLYYYNNNPLVKKCINKYEVRDYIKSKGLQDILVNLIDVYDDADDIIFDNLPKKFVLKCTSGSGNNIIVDDKNNINVEEIKETVRRWKKEKYEQRYAELQYKGIPIQIICEEYLSDDICDYKFFCFHGEPKFLYVSKGLGKHENLKMNYLDMNFKSFGVSRDCYSNDLIIPKPDNFDKMIEISKILSKDFPFVRVDLYNIRGKIYFSELTFVPTGGLMKVDPMEYDYKWGEYLDLSSINK